MARICIVGETDPFVASLLQLFAETSGLHVVRVQVGQDLPDLVRQVQPDVIILDAELPGKMRGWEAARVLKSDPETSGIPIITCSWLPEVEATTLIKDAVGHLQKPELHYDDFVAALRAASVEPTVPLTDHEVVSPLADPDQVSVRDSHTREPGS